MGIPKEHLPTKSNATSANSEFSAEELAETYIESLESLADSDFYFATAVDYIAGSMTDSELELFLTEIRNVLTEIHNSEPTASTETPNNEATPAEIIDQIVERVSDGISIEELDGILEDIQTYNLNPADIIQVIDGRMEKGSAVSPSDAHELQDTPYNCGPTLAKVVLAQHGIHISEGELTLRTFLEGIFDVTHITECFEFLFGLFSGCITTSALGTSPRDMGYILEKSGVPVDYNYSASLNDVETALAEGKSVIVAVDVEPIWKAGPGGHVLQVLHIDRAKDEVTVNDTGQPHGSAIKYPLEDFLEACEKYTPEAGIFMIATEEAPPSTDGSVSTLVPHRSPIGVGDVQVVVVNGERIEVDPELTAVFNGNSDSEGEKRPPETEEIGDPVPPSKSPDDAPNLAPEQGKGPSKASASDTQVEETVADHTEDTPPDTPSSSDTPIEVDNIDADGMEAGAGG